MPASAHGGARTPGLIVNADDYGLTRGVSEGIRAAHREGIVTSTTVLIVAPGARTDLRIAMAETPSLGIGVHLALTGPWRPILGRTVRTLRNYRERMPTSADLAAAIDRADRWEVRAEWRAQIEAVISAGIDPDHLDGHHNLPYRNAELFEILLELAADYRLPVRLPVGPSKKLAARAGATAKLIPDDQLRQLASSSGINHPDRMLDGFGTGSSTDNLIGMLQGLRPDEVTELMCHPGRLDWRLRAKSSYTRWRATELAILTDARVLETIEAQSIQLTTFAALGPPQPPRTEPRVSA